MATRGPSVGLQERAFRLEPYSYAEARAIASALGLAEPVAVALVRRGYRTVEAARAFLEAPDAHDPFEFDAMREAVDRIRGAIARGLRITIHGDYDVDGVCSTTIMVRALRELGADCDWYIPGRLEDGYGLTAASVERLAARGTRLLITVDCGIGSADEVAAARAAGMEVIVTDHHQPGERLPECPVLHPTLSGYPCPDLCATGVAYKLGAALLGPRAAERDLDLVALATVADLVPLRGENRSLVRRGLAMARLAERPGLRALLTAARVDPARLDEGDLAFRLAPRINAAGRLYRADAGVELLLTPDEGRAARIAAELDGANRERRDAELEVLEAAERARAALPDEVAAGPALVLAGEGWHPGVVGIVASRLADRHWRPAVLISLDDEGRGRGSGRSIPGFDLLAGLRACAEHLEHFGGHRAAAGLEIEAARVEAFREAFLAHVAETLADGDLVRTELVDAVVGGDSLGLEVAEQLERLGPFGMGNPAVRLLVPSAELGDVRTMGRGDRHARFTLRSGPWRALGVAFGMNGKLKGAATAKPLDLSVRLELNEWNGAVEPRVVLGELYPGAKPDGIEGRPGFPAEPDDGEWWERVRAEMEMPLEQWPPAAAPTSGGRETVDRRRGSGIATVAALASSGEPVLVLCADALRRRALLEGAADPGRFGGGRAAIAAGRLADEGTRAAVAELLEAGSGIALADWARLERDPELPPRFPHVVLIDPPPFPHLEALASRGSGFLHLAWGSGELGLRVLERDWSLRPALAEIYRAMRGVGSAQGAALRDALAGPGPHSRSPEAAGRCARVLTELGLGRWGGSGAAPALGVVSSEETDLSRSEAFVAYRGRYEEGRIFLTGRTRSS